MVRNAWCVCNVLCAMCVVDQVDDNVKVFACELPTVALLECAVCPLLAGRRGRFSGLTANPYTASFPIRCAFGLRVTLGSPMPHIVSFLFFFSSWFLAVLCAFIDFSHFLLCSQGASLHLELMYLELSFYDLRRKRRGSVSTKATPNQCWNVCE